MSILVFGASGFAGQCIKKTLEEIYSHVFGTYCTLNKDYEKEENMLFYKLGSEESLLNVLEISKPQIVISCLRGDFTKQLELHRRLSEYLKNKEEGKLIFLSSANVFDGAMDRPHYENDNLKAESEYGNFKIQCENTIISILDERGIILRIPQIYGENCPRLRELEEAVRMQKAVKTFKNIMVNYTTDVQIAKWIEYILEN